MSRHSVHRVPPKFGTLLVECRNLTSLLFVRFMLYEPQLIAIRTILIYNIILKDVDMLKYEERSKFLSEFILLRFGDISLFLGKVKGTNNKI